MLRIFALSLVISLSGCGNYAQPDGSGDLLGLTNPISDMSSNAVIAYDNIRVSDLSTPTTFIYGAEYGYQTLDGASIGGNPFATAFIDALASDHGTNVDFIDFMKSRTWELSEGLQSVDIKNGSHLPQTALAPSSSSKDIALITVISDYSKSQAYSLPGALNDAQRVTEALSKAGFETTLLLDVSKNELIDELNDFRARSQSADRAIVYSTGHGLGVDGTTYLLMGDVPLTPDRPALDRYAISVFELGHTLSAKSSNIVFWAGCRDNPLNW